MKERRSMRKRSRPSSEPRSTSMHPAPSKGEASEAGNRRAEVNDMDTAIAGVLTSYASAVFSKDVKTFMHLYDPNVRVFDAWGVWSYGGAAAWQVAVEGWFTSLGTENVKVTF